MANFHAIVPFPGIYLYDNVDKFGVMSDELVDFTYQGAAFIPHSMTKEQILDLRQKAFRRFYSRPSFIMKKILALRSKDDLKTAFKAARSLFWLWTQQGLFGKRK